MARIFVGVGMPEKIQNLAAGWASDKLTWPVRWLKPSNLHLTLVPPFYENDLEKVIGKLAQIKASGAPLLYFQEISYGPPENFRLIWAIGKPSPELEKIKTAAEQTLGVKAEKRSFLPHLTLARFRPEDFRRLKIKNLSERIDWSGQVESFVLFESILTPVGAEYKVLKSFEL